MCHDYEGYLLKARIAERMRVRKPVVDDSQKQRDATPPAAPAEPEKRRTDQEPVPA